MLLILTTKNDNVYIQNILIVSIIRTKYASCRLFQSQNGIDRPHM